MSKSWEILSHRKTVVTPWASRVEIALKELPRVYAKYIESPVKFAWPNPDSVPTREWQRCACQLRLRYCRGNRTPKTWSSCLWLPVMKCIPFWSVQHHKLHFQTALSSNVRIKPAACPVGDLRCHPHFGHIDEIRVTRRKIGYSFVPLVNGSKCWIKVDGFHHCSPSLGTISTLMTGWSKWVLEDSTDKRLGLSFDQWKRWKGKA